VNLDQFFNELQHFKWYKKTGLIGAIRCSKGDCPILAVYRHQHPQTEYKNSDYRAAGDALGLSIQDQLIITRAADGWWSLPDVTAFKKRLLNIVEPYTSSGAGKCELI